MTNTHLEHDNRFLRLNSIVGDRKTGTPGILPMAASTWWAGVKSGRYPAPVKLGPRITAWRLEDVLAVAKKRGGNS
jgi:prophage regulatory protein